MFEVLVNNATLKLCAQRMLNIIFTGDAAEDKCQTFMHESAVIYLIHLFQIQTIRTESWIKLYNFSAQCDSSHSN